MSIKKILISYMYIVYSIKLKLFLLKYLMRLNLLITHYIESVRGNIDGQPIYGESSS